VSDWQAIRLGDVLTLQRGFDLPARERGEGPFPIVSSAGVTGSHREFKVKPPGVVIGRYGSLGTVHWVSKPFWPLNTSLWVKDFKGNDPRFVAYLLKTVTVDGSTASAVPGVNRNHLHTRTVRRPSPAVQRRIAAVLSAFDELIAINERRIELLEDLARSLYHEWFVHFRFPGHNEVEFADSELGMIPEGWKAMPFASTGEFLNGFAFKPSHWGTEGPPIIKIKELKEGVTAATPRYNGTRLDPRYLIEPGDLLFSWSADLGVYVWADERGALNQHLFKVSPATGIDRFYLFHALSEALPQFRSLAQGTTMKHIKRSALSEVQCLVPRPELLASFAESVTPVHDEVLALKREIGTLAATRDLLLPRLVTGRLDISDVDLGDLVSADAA
jgi:type I restriction enzyme S subunit